MTIMHDKLKWRPFWATHVGAMKGCLDFLNIPMSDAWLVGGIGHAFIMNINDNVSAAGPTAWNTEMMRLLGHNLGFHVSGVFAWKSDPQFEIKQKLAWETARRALDQGFPCYGWGLGIAEYDVVCGYDSFGYYYSGIGTAEYEFDLARDRKQELVSGTFTEQLRQDLLRRGIVLSDNVRVERRFGCWIIKDEDDGRRYSVLEDKNGRLMFHGEYEISQGFKKWTELGASKLGLLELYSVEPAFTSDDDAIVKEALEFALEFAQEPRKWVKDGFHTGLTAYETWKRAFDNRRADGFGTAYNASVWQECRMLASQFLQEAAERIGGSTALELREAARWYDSVAQELNILTERFPFHQRNPEHIRDEDALDQASRALSRAQIAEHRAMEKLQRIVHMI